MKVVLASASPRRLELLKQVGVEAQVCPAAFAEEAGQNVPAQLLALHNAVGKCLAVVAAKGDAVPVIAADTIVVIDDVVLGKPHDAHEAAAILARLSGRKHEVLTAVAVACAGKEIARVCATEVFFRELTKAEIAAYVAMGEPLDKAGAYGIQGKGALLVKKIEGCYNNVVGLPLTMLDSMLKEIGVNMTA